MQICRSARNLEVGVDGAHLLDSVSEPMRPNPFQLSAGAHCSSIRISGVYSWTFALLMLAAGGTEAVGGGHCGSCWAFGSQPSPVRGLAGASKEQKHSHTKLPSSAVVDPRYEGKPVAVSLGGAVEVRLPLDFKVGTWSPIAPFQPYPLEITGDPTIESISYAPYLGHPDYGVPGAPYIWVARFRAVAVGKSTIGFALHPPGAPNSSVRQIWLSLIVDQDGSGEGDRSKRR